MPLHQAYQRLQALLRSYGRLAVAFSGGTDSSLLLKAALDTLGPQQVLALFAQSELLKTVEIDRVHQWARQNGYESSLTLEVVEIEPLAWSAFRHNPPDRCYLCKGAIYTAFLERIQALGIEVLADGT
ncbi:MAG TPA: TIGR00268 family protein, partial [Syntrophomonas sp.]|nr:TIGR00268 family protein [Syntrophomonas sp.]